MKPISEYRWIYPDTEPVSEVALNDEVDTKRLADELTISHLLAHLLVERGIRTFEQAHVFFRPTLNDLHDPFLMDGMSTAVALTLQALKQKQTILIYGDYDVDGTNGTALLVTFLKKAGGNVYYHVPDRIKEGYGISVQGIDRAEQLNVSLLITVDCGITACTQIAEARKRNIDVIICDHHEPGAELPDANAVLDPLKPSCSYPYKYLSGCGVAFKFVEAMLRTGTLADRFPGDIAETLYSYLDYVTLAATADIVPLTGENRVLVKLGLEKMNSAPRPGVSALMETAGLKKGKINSGNIVFVLAPRINAVGRLGDASRAVELLMTESYEEALAIAQICESENQNRRKLDEDTFAEAIAYAEELYATVDTPAIVLHSDTWHAGVIGIVASRLAERYHRPSIMLTTIDGTMKGSARSVSGFDLYDALKQCEHTLLQFGGHKYAAGLSVEPHRFEEFRSTFLNLADRLLTDELRTPGINIQAKVSLSEITLKFIRILSQFAPFGPMNMRPVFAARDVTVAHRPGIVGNKHLKFKVRENGTTFDTIGFNMSDRIDNAFVNRKTIDIAFTITENEYNGQTQVQLALKDFK